MPSVKGETNPKGIRKPINLECRLPEQDLALLRRLAEHGHVYKTQVIKRLIREAAQRELGWQPEPPLPGPQETPGAADERPHAETLAWERSGQKRAVGA